MGEDDTYRTVKTMLPESPIDPNFPSLESCFEVDERGKNGREKRKRDRTRDGEIAGETQGRTRTQR